MSVTHGNNYRIFEWQLLYGNNIVYIENTKGKHHSYEVKEIFDILRWLKATFGKGWFPLANNVVSMGNGQEIDGLGIAILNLTPRNLLHAQGSSYLGVVMEEVGIFEWNGKKRGIQWRMVKTPKSVKHPKQLISDAK